MMYVVVTDAGNKSSWRVVTRQVEVLHTYAPLSYHNTANSCIVVRGLWKLGLDQIPYPFPPGGTGFAHSKVSHGRCLLRETGCAQACLNDG